MTEVTPPADWTAGATAHGLALLLARRRLGPGVDMGGRDNPTPGEEQDAARFVRDMLDSGWLDPDQAARIRAEVDEYQAIFDLGYQRMGEAADLWRAEVPAERSHIMPDLGTLLGWLMNNAQLPLDAALAASVAERDRLAAEREQLLYERRLLGFARRTLDLVVAGPQGSDDWGRARREAADIAQRIVDEIGHPVTDEDALGPSFREQIVALTAEVAEWAQMRGEIQRLYDVEREADRMRPVVEAAKEWRASELAADDFHHAGATAAVDLIAAVDAYTTAHPDDAETVESVSEAAGWIRDERDAAETRLLDVHDLLDRLDQSGQDYTTDTIRAALGTRERPWADWETVDAHLADINRVADEGGAGQ